MQNSTNPLFKHFRQPQLYIKLPSEGKYYPAGAIDFPVTKEIPVYSMTAADEIIWKTPDALLNGQATVDVIHSCVPNIKNAWMLPNIDMDAIIIGIRRATYGNMMDLITLCPHCKRKNEQQLNLELLSTRFKPISFDETVKVEDLEIFLRPQLFNQVNKANIEKFEQQRALAIINNDNLSEEEKIQQFNQTFKRLVSLTVDQISDSVLAIRTADSVLVEEREYIVEFLKNCNKTIWNAIKERLESISQQSPLMNIDITCEYEDCAKTYESPLIFEQSNFFA
jgi:hypothetical protein